MTLDERDLFEKEIVTDNRLARLVGDQLKQFAVCAIDHAMHVARTDVAQMEREAVDYLRRALSFAWRARARDHRAIARTKKLVDGIWQYVPGGDDDLRVWPAAWYNLTIAVVGVLDYIRTARRKEAIYAAWGAYMSVDNYAIDIDRATGRIHTREQLLRLPVEQRAFEMVMMPRRLESISEERQGHIAFQKQCIAALASGKKLRRPKFDA